MRAVSEYTKAFITSVGGRWFLIPSFVSGTAALLAILRSLGMDWIPEVSYSQLVVLALVPIVSWSLIGLLRQVVHLNRELQPHIVLHPPETVMTARQEGILYKVRLKISNEGGKHLKDCLVTLDKLEPLPLNLSEDDLPVAVPTEGQVNQSRTGRFCLNPKQPKYIQLVTFVSSNNPNNPITVISERWRRTISRHKKYQMTMNAYSEIGLPSTQTFHIFVDSKEVMQVDGAQ